MIVMDAEGRLWKGSNEVFNLTEHELDEVINNLYPKDPVLLDQYMTKKRATSYSGSSYGFSLLVNKEADTANQDELKIPDEQVLAMGGIRLLAIYRASCNLQVAADELGMREDALRKWFYRWRQDSASHEVKAIIREAISPQQDEANQTEP